MRQQDFTLQEKLSMLVPRTVAATTPSGYVEGFDLSKWTVIKDAAAALVGQTFAIPRARDGIRDDSQWSTNKALAKQLPFWGAYAFFNPRFMTNEAPSGWTQAQEFLAITKPAREFDGLNIPLVIDCENSPNFTMPPAARYLHELKYYVEAMSVPVNQGGLGRKPIIYSRAQWINLYTVNDMWRTRYDWWLAQYLYDRTIARPAPPALPSGVTTWLIHQNCDKKPAWPGFAAPDFIQTCDINRWNGDDAAVVAYFGGMTLEQRLVSLEAWARSDPNRPYTG